MRFTRFIDSVPNIHEAQLLDKCGMFLWDVEEDSGYESNINNGCSLPLLARKKGCLQIF
jgi:hypothetical protein